MREDEAVKVVADWRPQEPGVFHAECWNAYEDGFAEQPDNDEPVEAPPDEPSSSVSDKASTSWRRKGVLAALGLLLGVGVAVVILTSSSDSGSPTSPDAVILQSSLPNSASSEGLGAALGQPAPRLVGTSLDGSPLTIAPGGGARHAIIFLAHWCSPCQREVREIVKLANRGELNGLEVAGVVTATSPLRANYPPSTWLERERWPYPTLADNASRTAANAYGITSIPTVVLVAENAEVVARLGNLQSGNALRTLRNFAAGR